MPNETIKPKVVEKKVENKSKYITNPDYTANKACKWVEDMEKEGYELYKFRTPVTVGQGIRYVFLMRKKGK